MASSDEAIEAIYAAGLDPRGWHEVVAEIGSLFRTATGTFYIDRSDPHGVEASLVASFGHSEKAVASYMDHFGNVNPFDRNLDRFAVGEPVTDATLDRRLREAGAFENSEYYNDWVRPQHIRHLLGGYVDRVGQGTLVASFWRSADAGAYTASDVDAFGGLMRHATRAIEVGSRLRSAEAEMDAVLARSRQAVFAMGPDGRIRRCNVAAEALLASATVVRRAGARLEAAVAQDQPALGRLIACAADPRLAAWAENASVTLRRTDGKPPVAVRAIAIAQRFGLFAPDRAASVILTLEGFEPAEDRLAERLHRRFGLTAAQTRLALALRAGRSLAAAADGIGISRETARSHLKKIFARTGTHRQAELVLLLRDIELA